MGSLGVDFWTRFVEPAMLNLLVLIVALSLSGCAVGLALNAAGATPGNVPALHPEQGQMTAGR